jgi:hypothetical protein
MAYLVTHPADLRRQNVEAALQKAPNFLYCRKHPPSPHKIQ